MLGETCEHGVDDGAVFFILFLAVRLHILLEPADLVVDIDADGQHFLERAVIGQEASDDRHADHHGVERGGLSRCSTQRHCCQKGGSYGQADFFRGFHSVSLLFVASVLP